MKILVSMAVATLVALPAYAGEQPVILIAMPTAIDDRVYLFDSPIPSNVRTITGVAAQPAASSGGSGVVAGAALNQRESDVLYARLMKEAKARGLR